MVKTLNEKLNKLTEDRGQDIHKDYTNLKNKTTGEVHKIHQQRSKISGNYTAADAGGKQGMISDILNDRYGHSHVSNYFKNRKKYINCG